MMKKFIISIICVFISTFMCVCYGEQSLILFNKQPISKNTITSSTNTNLFKPGERIFYLITLPKPVKSKSLLIQIVKIGGGKDERLGYELVWGKRVHLKDEQKHFFTDYIVFNETGAYAMKVYSRDNPAKILTSAYFYVKD